MTIATQYTSDELRSNTHLRVAINLGNIALARTNTHSGDLEGVSIELAKELSSHIESPLQFIIYPSAGRIVDAAERDEWDIAFLAFDPSREDRLAFSRPYALLEATFLTRAASRYFSAGEFDAPGIKLSVTRNAAYELYLRDHFKKAEIVHAATPGEALERLVSHDLHAAAGIRQALDEFSADNPEFRVLTDSFLSIRQCVATRKQSADIGSLVAGFMEELQHNGLPDTVTEAARRSDVKLCGEDTS